MRTTISWPTKKKVEYSKSDDTAGSGSPEPFVYPNQAYIPFVCFYNPDASSYKANATDEQRQILLTTNACHWFNDA